MKFFETSLPVQSPEFIHESKRAEFTRVLQTIHSRMEKLERALSLVTDTKGQPMSGETFSHYAKKLFDVTENFDGLSAEDIAFSVETLYDGKEFPARMCWKNCITVVDTAFVRTPEWEAIRALSIGGSEAAVILSESPYQTPFGLYHSKVGTPITKKEDAAKQAVFTRGHIIEPKVVEAFVNLTGATIIPETRMLAHKDFPYSTANIDAICSFADGRIFVFEAKSAAKGAYSEQWSENSIPLHYVEQMTQYLAVLDDDRVAGAYIGALFVDDYVVGDTYCGSQYDVERFCCRVLDRNKTVEQELLKAENQWWQTHMLAGKEPSYSVLIPQKDISTINELAPPVNPCAAAVNFQKEFYGKAEEYLGLKNEQKRHEEIAKEYERAAKKLSIEFIEGMGNSTEGIVHGQEESDFFKVQYLARSKSSVDQKRLHSLIDAARAFCPTELIEQMNSCFKKEDGAIRVFSIKKGKPQPNKRS